MMRNSASLPLNSHLIEQFVRYNVSIINMLSQINVSENTTKLSRGLNGINKNFSVILNELQVQGTVSQDKLDKLIAQISNYILNNTNLAPEWITPIRGIANQIVDDLKNNCLECKNILSSADELPHTINQILDNRISAEAQVLIRTKDLQPIRTLIDNDGDFFSFINNGVLNFTDLRNSLRKLQLGILSRRFSNNTIDVIYRALSEALQNIENFVVRDSSKTYEKLDAMHNEQLKRANTAKHATRASNNIFTIDYTATMQNQNNQSIAVNNVSEADLVSMRIDLLSTMCQLKNYQNIKLNEKLFATQIYWLDIVMAADNLLKSYPDIYNVFQYLHSSLATNRVAEKFSEDLIRAYERVATLCILQGADIEFNQIDGWMLLSNTIDLLKSAAQFAEHNLIETKRLNALLAWAYYEYSFKIDDALIITKLKRELVNKLPIYLENALQCLHNSNIYSYIPLISNRGTPENLVPEILKFGFNVFYDRGCKSLLDTVYREAMDSYVKALKMANFMNELIPAEDVASATYALMMCYTRVAMDESAKASLNQTEKLSLTLYYALTLLRRAIQLGKSYLEENSLTDDLENLAISDEHETIIELDAETQNDNLMIETEVEWKSRASAEMQSNVDKDDDQEEDEDYEEEEPSFSEKIACQLATCKAKKNEVKAQLHQQSDKKPATDNASPRLSPSMRLTLLAPQSPHSPRSRANPTSSTNLKL